MRLTSNRWTAVSPWPWFAASVVSLMALCWLKGLQYAVERSEPFSLLRSFRYLTEGFLGRLNDLSGMMLAAGMLFVVVLAAGARRRVRAISLTGVTPALDLRRSDAALFVTLVLCELSMYLWAVFDDSGTLFHFRPQTGRTIVYNETVHAIQVLEGLIKCAWIVIVMGWCVVGWAIWRSCGRYAIASPSRVNVADAIGKAVLAVFTVVVTWISLQGLLPATGLAAFTQGISDVARAVCFAVLMLVPIMALGALVWLS
jgi:hypothetical protein